MTLLIAGGRMRPAGALDRDHEALYDEARLARLDPRTGELDVLLSWRSPAFDRPGLGHCFKGARWDGDELLLCTEREVLRVDPAGWEVREVVSHPWFNDLHDVARIDGQLHVVSTGLDAVLVLDDGQVTAAHGVLGPFRGRPEVDYRAVSTKPHRSHPNHVFEVGGRVWATRLEQQDAVCLDDPGLRLPLEVGPVHDGLPVGTSVWFTVVDGRLVAVDAEERAVERVVSLRDDDPEPPGWCRGLHIDGDRAFVGFSRLRTTRTRHHLARIRGWLRGRQDATRRPTRVVALDLAEERIIGAWPTGRAGLDAIFAILPERR